MYEWLRQSLEQLFQEEQLLKRSPRGSVRLLRHRETGQRFVLRHFTGSAEVYRQLLHCTCQNLPTVYEAVSRNNENLSLEEYIQGDKMCIRDRAISLGMNSLTATLASSLVSQAR